MRDISGREMRCREWGIYHRDREFARESGDPCLGIVTASDKAEAENEATLQGISGPTGIWAHPLSDVKDDTKAK